MDRRSFLGGMAAAGALVATGTLAGCGNTPTVVDNTNTAATTSSSASWKEKPAAITDVAQTVDVDIVVIGAGNGGLVAACTAVEAGATVAILEKTPEIAMAKEAIGAIGSKYQTNFPVDVARLIKEVDLSQDSTINANLYRTWGEKSGEMIDWMSDILTANGIEVALESAAPDATIAPEAYYPPICHNTFAGGYNPGGPNYGMYAHLTALQTYFEQNGGTIYFETPGQQLIQDDRGKVTGVIATNSDTGNIQFNAEKGVIICTGGYGGNDDMMQDLCKIGNDYCALTSAISTGDGIKMALWAGGALEPAGAAMIWNRAILTDDAQLGTPWSGTIFLPGSQPFLHVNKYGERYCNEDKPYPMGFTAGVAQPGHYCWSVWDSSYWEDIQQFATTGCSRLAPAPSGTAANADVYDCEAMTKEHLDSYWLQPSIDSGALKVCDTLDKLADAMNLDADSKATFLATVKRYNGFVDAGVDADFGKETYRMSKVDAGPFYAARMSGVLLCTMNGIYTDTNSQVIDDEGNTIPNLYVCGNDQGGFYPRNYPSQLIGMNMGRVSTFSRIAAKHALGVN